MVVNKIGIIGGYSTYRVLDKYSEEKISEGLVSFKGKVGGKTVYIIPRHGKNHKYPPHRVPLIDYFDFLKDNGVKDLVTLNSVGILNRGWKVPCLVIINDFIDFTGELATIYNSFEKDPVHVEMDEPYHKPYQDLITKLVKENRVQLYHGIYFQMIGPRLETRAEIRAANALGADMVGMTHSWEVILAREYGMRLLGLGMGVNYACGIGEKLDYRKVISESKVFSDQIKKLLRKFIQKM